MTKNQVVFVVLLLLTVFLQSAVLAEEANGQSAFVSVVIERAIEFMPAEQRAKLTSVRKEIISGAKFVSASGKPAAEPYYFVGKSKGTAPADLAEQFRLTREALAKNSDYPKIAPSLGRLAAYVISVCQPYHSDETAYGSPSHMAFEKRLDASSASLKAKFDKLDKVNDPKSFVLATAKEANKLLQQLQTKAEETKDPAAIDSAVFSLAVNSVVDCWHTVLSTQSSATSNQYIGNKNSHKFHLPTCRHLPDEKNRIYFKSKEEALTAGYTPCKVCNP